MGLLDKHNIDDSVDLDFDNTNVNTNEVIESDLDDFSFQDEVVDDTESKSSITLTKDTSNTYTEVDEYIDNESITEDIKDTDGTVLVKSGTTMDRDDVKKVAHLNLTELKVRSGLTCGLEYGICQKCYGWAMTTQKLVDIGEAIGIIAAQSIGEPGTQLTMRTFHTGGVFKGAGAMKSIEAKTAGEVVSSVKTRELRTRHGDVVRVSITEGDIEVVNELFLKNAN